MAPLALALPELCVILVVVVVLAGPRIPGIARGVGQGLGFLFRGFRD